MKGLSTSLTRAARSVAALMGLACLVWSGLFADDFNTTALQTRFSNTTWTCEAGGFAFFITFKSDGTWTEDYGGNHSKGRWTAYSGDKATVYRSDTDSVAHYSIRPDKSLWCDVDNNLYHLVAWNTDNPAPVYAGTSWIDEVNGSPSIIGFNPDGTWKEDWNGRQLRGTWKADPANTNIVVTCSDNSTYRYRLTADSFLVSDERITLYHLLSTTPLAAAAPTPTPTPTDHPVVTVKMTEAQSRSVVLIKGDNAEGTGFLVKMPDGPVVVTNIHVISNNPNIVITTTTGETITPVSLKGAVDRDLCIFGIKDNHYNYLTVPPDIGAIAQPGDDVVTPGNSEGGEVMLNTGGKLLGIGPDRIEFDNPIYHGNSGGPVLHVKSGMAIGIVTEAVKVDVSDELDKASFANRNSAIGNSMRYFGFRLDNVPKWEPYNWQRLQTETAFLDQFDDLTKALDSYLNAPDDNKPEDNTWRKNDKIVTANSNYFDRISGADTSQQLDATRQLYQDFRDLADQDLQQMQNLNNFYSFDQQRAKEEMEYRKALAKEMDGISNNVDRMCSMPRTNSSAN